MSSNLMALLERINRQKEEPKPLEEKPPELSPNLLALMRRVENRELLEEARAETFLTIKDIKEDLKLINHVLKCGNCMFELILDVERYGGSKSGISSLDLNNNEILEFYSQADEDDFTDDFESPLDRELLKAWREIPKAENYRIGNYWLMLKGESNFETERFIRDRLEWHRKMLIIQLRKAREYYRSLLKWNVEEVPPLPYTRVI